MKQEMEKDEGIHILPGTVLQSHCSTGQFPTAQLVAHEASNSGSPDPAPVPYKS